MMMTLREPPALTEPPDDGEWHAWREHSLICGDLAEWAQDWAATCDPDDYPNGSTLRKAVEQLRDLMVEVFEQTPDFADRYEDRAA